jgi:hypothetical protein
MCAMMVRCLSSGPPSVDRATENNTFWLPGIARSTTPIVLHRRQARPMLDSPLILPYRHQRISHIRRQQELAHTIMDGLEHQQLLPVLILYHSLYRHRQAKLIVGLKRHHAFHPRYQVPPSGKNWIRPPAVSMSPHPQNHLYHRCGCLFQNRKRIKIRHPGRISPEMKMPTIDLFRRQIEIPAVLDSEMGYTFRCNDIAPEGSDSSA